MISTVGGTEAVGSAPLEDPAAVGVGEGAGPGVHPASRSTAATIVTARSDMRSG